MSKAATTRHPEDVAVPNGEPLCYRISLFNCDTMSPAPFGCMASLLTMHHQGACVLKSTHLTLLQAACEATRRPPDSTAGTGIRTSARQLGLPAWETGLSFAAWGPQVWGSSLTSAGLLRRDSNDPVVKSLQ